MKLSEALKRAENLPETLIEEKGMAVSQKSFLLILLRAFTPGLDDEIPPHLFQRLVLLELERFDLYQEGTGIAAKYKDKEDFLAAEIPKLADDLKKPGELKKFLREVIEATKGDFYCIDVVLKIYYNPLYAIELALLSDNLVALASLWFKSSRLVERMTSESTFEQANKTAHLCLDCKITSVSELLNPIDIPYLLRYVKGFTASLPMAAILRTHNKDLIYKLTPYMMNHLIDLIRHLKEIRQYNAPDYILQILDDYKGHLDHRAGPYSPLQTALLGCLHPRIVKCLLDEVPEYFICPQDVIRATFPTTPDDTMKQKSFSDHPVKQYIASQREKERVYLHEVASGLYDPLRPFYSQSLPLPGSFIEDFPMHESLKVVIDKAKEDKFTSYSKLTFLMPIVAAFGRTNFSQVNAKEMSGWINFFINLHQIKPYCDALDEIWLNQNLRQMSKNEDFVRQARRLRKNRDPKFQEVLVLLDRYSQKLPATLEVKEGAPAAAPVLAAAVVVEPAATVATPQPSPELKTSAAPSQRGVFAIELKKRPATVPTRTKLLEFVKQQMADCQKTYPKPAVFFEVRNTLLVLQRFLESGTVRLTDRNDNYTSKNDLTSADCISYLSKFAIAPQAKEAIESLKRGLIEIDTPLAAAAGAGAGPGAGR